MHDCYSKLICYKYHFQVFPDKEIQKILKKKELNDIGDYAETQLQILRTSIYEILRKHAEDKGGNVAIQLYVLKNEYMIGDEDNFTVIINITRTEMFIEVRQPLYKASLFSSIINKIKEWWKTILNFFS